MIYFFKVDMIMVISMSTLNSYIIIIMVYINSKYTKKILSNFYYMPNRGYKEIHFLYSLYFILHLPLHHASF